MSRYVCEDFAAIAQALKKLPQHSYLCDTCQDLGWKSVNESGVVGYRICPNCHNIYNRPIPL